MTTAASKKFQSQFELFIRSDQYNELVGDTAVFNGPSLVNAVTLWVSSGGLKNTSKTSSQTSSKKKSSAIDGPQCCARTYNGGGCLDGKICGRKGTVMVDGIPCCPQHSKPYAGNFKGFPEKKGIVGFCAGCSLLAGKDVIHDCPRINLLGFKHDEDSQLVCQPVCISRAQQHTDYDGERLGEDKPKSTRGRKKGSVTTKSKKPSPSQEVSSDDDDDQHQDTEEEPTVKPKPKPAPRNNTRRKSVSTENSSDDEEEEQEEEEEDEQEQEHGSEWEMAEIDLDDGDGECVYWVKQTENGMDVYTNDDIDDRIKLGTIDEDGVYSALD